jgi:RNA methyltransferase, TrmH family
MLSRNQVKHIHSLRLKKQREIHRQFIAEGSRLVIDLVKSPYGLDRIFATEEWLSDHAALLQASRVPFYPVKEKELARITALNTPSPVLAVVSIPEDKDEQYSFDDKLVLVLDDIRDPGNLGTIIRIADWFGIDAVVCSENTVDLYNPKVVQATMGSIARVPVFYTDLAVFLSGLPVGTNVFGAFLEGENIYQTDLPEKGIMIIGSEATGISPKVERFVTKKLHIPSFTGKAESMDHAESLNASVATAVICSEFKRRTL